MADSLSRAQAMIQWRVVHSLRLHTVPDRTTTFRDFFFTWFRERLKREPFSNHFAVFREMATERTFIAIKPDGVQRGLVGEIIKRFEQRGYKLVAMKLCRPGKEHLEKHYADLSSKVSF